MNKKYMYKAMLLTLSSMIMSAGFADIDTSTRQYDNFKDNNIDPFEVCTTKSPNTVKTFKKRVKTQWHRDGWDDGRVSKGVEACAEMPITDKGKFAFTFNLPKSGSGAYGKARYPSDKEGAIAQIFQNGEYCGGSWALLVIVKENKLIISHRGSCGNPTDHVIDQSIERDKDHYLVIEFDPSDDSTGYVKVTYNGVEKVNEENIRFGFAYSDQWSSDDNLSNGSYLTAKFGQYNYDDIGYETNHDSIRTVYYDNVNWRKQ